jgi:hypothetical protein
MKRNQKGTGFRVNGLLENGYFKLFGLCAALVAYVWQGATWKTSIEGQLAATKTHAENQLNMVSYQIAELDKRVSTQLVDLDKRMASIETRTDASSGWRASISAAVEMNSKLLSDLRGGLSERRR